jgi:aspartate/methionine/tyrosine aminotransferase
MAIFSSSEPLDAACGHYRQQRQFLIQELERLKLQYIKPEGAFYALLALPQTSQQNSLDTAIRLLENQRVLTIPGSAFGAENWLRISWVAPTSELRTGLERIATYFTAAPDPTPT